jgi:L-fucose isomerase-like protein
MAEENKDGVKIAYLPIGRKTFDMAAAQEVVDQSVALLRELCPGSSAEQAVLTSVEEVQESIRERQPAKPDLVLFQLATFAGSEFVVEAMAHYDCPIVVWSVREPSIGGRLRLNSLTGGNSACNALRYYEREFDFLFGNPTEEDVQAILRRKLVASATKRKLAQLTVGIVGEHPDGFAFCGADELALHKKLGVRLHRLDLYDLFRKSQDAPPEQWQPMLEEAAAKVRGLNKGEETAIKFAKFSSTLRKVLDERNIQAASVRCWPDFFTELGAAACSTLSQFTEDGLVSACESDIHGAVSMYIQQELSGGQPPYLGDLVSLDESRNSVTFWHCGAGAYSLADPSTGAKAGVHPNRKMGFALEFELKPGHVTICRLGVTSSGYRMLIMKGEALGGTQKFSGTSGEVRLSVNAKEVVRSLMLDGFEPHYSLVYSDIVGELEELCRLLKIDMVKYV